MFSKDNVEATLEVHVVRAPRTPLGCENMESTIRVPYDIQPDDFLYHIMRILNVDQGTMKLGWWSCDDSKTLIPCPLKTARDAERLLTEMRFLKEARKHQHKRKLVWVKVIDLVCELRHLTIAS